MRKSGLLVLSIITAFSVASVYAETIMLPEGSHYDGRIFERPFAGSEDYLRVDFAVYDTQAAGNETLFVDDGQNLVEGQYVYAYQIFNSAVSEEFVDFEVNFFTVLGIGEGSLSSGNLSDHIAFVDPLMFNAAYDLGVEPDYAWISPDKTEGYWDFMTSDDPVSAGEYSFIMLLGSDTDWQPGQYIINTPPLDSEIAVSENAIETIIIPEPCTLALLTIGGGMLLRNRRRKTL